MLSRLFRRLFLSALADAYTTGRLQFFGEIEGLCRREAFVRHLAPLRRKNWFVYAKPPFAGPEAVLAYLARYTHRVAIANSRLMALDERGVTFRYKDYRRDGQARFRTMTLAANEFIRRFLLHVLPKGFHRIRRYGLLASAACKVNIARARELIAAPIEAVDPPAAHDTADPRDPPDHRPPCPCCGGRMLIVETFGRGDAPRGPPCVPRKPVKPMTTLVVSLQRPAAGASRSRRRACFILASASVGTTPLISPRSGPRPRWQRPARSHQRLSPLTNLCETTFRQRRRATKSP